MNDDAKQMKVGIAWKGKHWSWRVKDTFWSITSCLMTLIGKAKSEYSEVLNQEVRGRN